MRLKKTGSEQDKCGYQCLPHRVTNCRDIVDRYKFGKAGCAASNCPQQQEKVQRQRKNRGNFHSELLAACACGAYSILIAAIRTSCAKDEASSFRIMLDL